MSRLTITFVPLTIDAFLARWTGSAGDEKAHKDAFLLDLCRALDLPTPAPNDEAYCFEKRILRSHMEGTETTVFADLYREGCFVLEAKQGSTKAIAGSTPIRGTRAYDKYMEGAFGQVRNYALHLNPRPPFLLTCDLGHAFHIWEGFGGLYGGYGARRTIPMADLRKVEVQDFFRALWLDVQSLDPARKRTRVTRDVAGTLGELARRLEGRFPNEAIARFLMRIVFTFFAEDVGLLPERLFEASLSGPWKDHPEHFPKGLENLWDAMNTGGMWGPLKVLRFNGGLFQESIALALNADEIALLASAAHYDWSEVDPSIFGTLLETALDPKERHRLGAHYTPRAYVDRLLRPALEQPLREEWDLAQAEALAVLGENPGPKELEKARDVLHRFQARLASVTVLDPACGSGNFLAASYAVLTRIEAEVQRRLEDLGESRRALALDDVTVTPKQFLGIELKPWAAAIADLVLWISHLQAFHRAHPDFHPPEPVLQAYGNIQQRDAVLTWKATKETGRSRWDGVTFKTHPVTGLPVPDETAQTPIVEYVDPEPAPWPEADFIVGNPPFLGNARMREALGDGYAEALRQAYPEVSDTVDLVLYWWHRAALAVREGRTQRFGLITTNSLRQIRQRGVIAHHTGAKKQPLKLLWAIPDHPWHDQGAAVRIAMTVGGLEGQPWLGSVTREAAGLTPEQEAEAVVVEGGAVDAIHEDLSAGASLAQASALKANDGLASRGMQLIGGGFIVTPQQFEAWERPAVVHPYLNGRDLTDRPRGVMVIDLYGLKEAEVQHRHPAVYQHVYDHVKPERDQNNRAAYRDNWWIYGEARSRFRPALAGLSRFIATVETAKHRVFQFLDGATVPDNMLIAVASADAFHLGVLSSRVHVAWALAAGGVLEDRPRYNKTRCFDPFPFPEATEPQGRVIRDLAERLDAHRKGAQGRGITITPMYNLLEKLRSGEAFTPKDRDQHAAAQTEILRQLHEDLDRAVLDAYGWPADLDDAAILEKLVALNRERAAEEKRGLIRWLRPEYQNPIQPLVPLPEQMPFQKGKTTPLPVVGDEAEEAAIEAVATGTPKQPWPKDLKAQLAALRALLLADDRLWTLEAIAGAFSSRGRYRESIATHLELLADLGIIHRSGTPGEPTWHRPQAMGA